ncbi:MAG: C39 family peptidase, partial [Raoultibacter sp.]
MDKQSTHTTQTDPVTTSRRLCWCLCSRKTAVMVTLVLSLALIIFIAVREPLTSVAETLGIVESSRVVDEVAEAVGSAAVSLEVTSLYQNPELPTGCESVALTDLLLFWGFDLDKTTIADSWLPTSDFDFVYSFLGSPYDTAGN